MNAESRLPNEILEKASKRGNEYAWALADVVPAISASSKLGLICLGGVAQFRLPDAVYEMYWIEFDGPGKMDGEDQQAFLARNAELCIADFRAIYEKTDFLRETEPLKHLAPPEEVLRHLCFALYFV